MCKCAQILYEIKLHEIKLQDRLIHRHRGVLRYHVLFPSLVLICFHILVFHLKQIREEIQRFLHYL